MSRNVLKILIAIFVLLLASELSFVGIMHFTQTGDDALLQATPTDVTEPSTVPATEPSTAPVTEPSSEPTEPTETEPPDIYYTLTFVGDCTLGCTQQKANSSVGFFKTVGEDYDYVFDNVREYFENDDCTFANLEVVLADSGNSIDKTFTFRGPTAYTNILTGSSVEAVTLANNHTKDYGTAGYDSTKTALTDAGVSYVENYSSLMLTTDSGLRIGVYAADGSVYDIKVDDVTAGIQQLKEDGAEVIVAALHWGNEGEYHPTQAQQDVGKAAIDAGANIVWGHHPHVLQPVEEYNGGIILYSMSNFSFGGNTSPRDMDSAIAQVEIIRSPDNGISLGGLTLIPVSISSTTERNNYQPTPFEEGTEGYDRAMSKLDGTFEGADLVVDYSNINGGN